jgi:solute carrier family 6 amino acid transporter-like protein 5/7/9/14
MFLLFTAGIGYGQIFATIMVLLYYCSLIAITGFYLVHSFFDVLPWSKCADEWGDTCFDSRSSTRNNTNQSSSSELFF